MNKIVKGNSATNICEECSGVNGSIMVADRINIHFYNSSPKITSTSRSTQTMNDSSTSSDQDTTGYTYSNPNEVISQVTNPTLEELRRRRVDFFSKMRNADLEDEVMVENCVLLEAPVKGEGVYPTVPACQLLLSCQPPYQISRISVLCEARVMEVYGHHGEYIKTVKNELLEEADDIIVFRGDVILERPLALCSIKFAGLRNASEMWLYGVKIHRIKQDFDQESPITIPLAAVEQRLAQMGLTLSDKAEAFKQLVEKCQKSPMLGQLDIGYLISTLQQSNLVKNKSPSPESAQNFSSSAAESFMKAVGYNQNNLKDYIKVDTPLSKDSNQNSPVPPYYVTSSATSPMVRESSTIGTQTDEEYINLEGKIKDFMSEQMLELDKKLWDRINQKFQEMEAKLMCKLDEIESFVKPQGISSS